MKTGKSNLNQLELFLARAAFWANPISWQIGPACACWHTMFRVALGFVIDPAADGANIGFEVVVAHGGVLRLGGESSVGVNIAVVEQADLGRVQGV